jgi:hypothetical protein
VTSTISASTWLIVTNVIDGLIPGTDWNNRPELLMPPSPGRPPGRACFFRHTLCGVSPRIRSACQAVLAAILGLAAGCPPKGTGTGTVRRSASSGNRPPVVVEDTEGG